MHDSLDFAQWRAAIVVGHITIIDDGHLHDTTWSLLPEADQIRRTRTHTHRQQDMYIVHCLLTGHCTEDARNVHQYTARTLQYCTVEYNTVQYSIYSTVLYCTL